MEYEEKLKYMQIATAIVGYGFDIKSLDIIVSLYDLVLEKQGETDLRSIVKIQCEADERETIRSTGKSE